MFCWELISAESCEGKCKRCTRMNEIINFYLDVGFNRQRFNQGGATLWTFQHRDDASRRRRWRRGRRFNRGDGSRPATISRLIPVGTRRGRWDLNFDPVFVTLRHSMTGNRSERHVQATCKERNVQIVTEILKGNISCRISTVRFVVTAGQECSSLCRAQWALIAMLSTTPTRSGRVRLPAVIRIDGTVHERIDATCFDLQTSREEVKKISKTTRDKRTVVICSLKWSKLFIFYTNDDAWTADDEWLLPSVSASDNWPLATAIDSVMDFFPRLVGVMGCTSWSWLLSKFKSTWNQLNWIKKKKKKIVE